MKAAAPSSSPVGRISAILDSLIDERRRLKSDRHEASLCEANQIAIVYWQRELERARARGVVPTEADLDH